MPVFYVNFICMLHFFPFHNNFCGRSLQHLGSQLSKIITTAPLNPCIALILERASFRPCVYFWLRTLPHGWKELHSITEYRYMVLHSCFRESLLAMRWVIAVCTCQAVQQLFPYIPSCMPWTVVCTLCAYVPSSSISPLSLDTSSDRKHSRRENTKTREAAYFIW